MNTHKETKNDQVDTIENKTQAQKHSLTHSEMLEYLRSTLITRNPNISVDRIQNQTKT